jgi:predicted TPR repeat methyltransferase
LSSSTTANARLLPDDPVAAAEALIEEGRAAEAAALLESCVAQNRGGLLLRLTLQKALGAAGDAPAALAAARESATLYPHAAPAALALGDALHACGHVPTAIGEFQRALRLDPHLESARISLGAAWLDAGEAEKALESWRAIEGESPSPALREMILDAEGMLRAPRSDPRYVRHLFDQFSVDYDSRMLGQLDYRAPAILRKLAQFLGIGGAKHLAILDLGCGTGLMGETVRVWADRLDGVDISPEMIAKTRAKAIYDELCVADICAWLDQSGRTYDVIFAADTLVYFGDVATLFSAARRSLADGGHFLFTTERKDGDGFDLGPKRRWRHSETYLRDAAERAGLRLAALMPCAPRTEAGQPVHGWAVALGK